MQRKMEEQKQIFFQINGLNNKNMENVVKMERKDRSFTDQWFKYKTCKEAEKKNTGLLQTNSLN